MSFKVLRGSFGSGRHLKATAAVADKEWRVKLLFWIKFEQKIWLDLQNRRYIENDFQRDCTNQVGCHNRAHVLSADANEICHLFLREIFMLPIIGYGAPQISVSLLIKTTSSIILPKVGLILSNFTSPKDSFSIQNALGVVNPRVSRFVQDRISDNRFFFHYLSAVSEMAV